MSAELLTYQMGIPPNAYSGVVSPQCENRTNSRWHELFGTPERTAQTLTHVCQFTHGGEMCERCRLYLFNDCDGTLRLKCETTMHNTLLEWLESEVRDD